MRWRLIVGLVWLLTSCALGQFSAQSAHYQIGVQVDTNGIGTRPVTVTLHDAQNAPVSDAMVTVVTVMPQHGMLSVPVPLVASGAGTYSTPALDLNMTGEWQLQIDIHRNDVHDTVTIPVTIK